MRSPHCYRIDLGPLLIRDHSRQLFIGSCQLLRRWNWHHQSLPSVGVSPEFTLSTRTVSLELTRADGIIVGLENLLLNKPRSDSKTKRNKRKTNSNLLLEPSRDYDRSHMSLWGLAVEGGSRFMCFCLFFFIFRRLGCIFIVASCLGPHCINNISRSSLSLRRR